MKLRSFLIAVLLVVAACEKSSDVDAMQSEANGLVNTYRARVASLEKRLQLLDQRGRQLPQLDQGHPDVKAVQQTFGEATQELKKLQDLAKGAPQAITAAANNEQSRDELVRLRGDLERRFLEGITVVTAKLDAVESWLTNVEWRGGQLASAADKAGQDGARPEDAGNPPPPPTPPGPENPGATTSTPTNPPSGANAAGSATQPANPTGASAGGKPATGTNPTKPAGTNTGSAAKPAKPATPPRPPGKPARTGAGSAAR